MACVVTPKIKNKDGELVDSELFKQLLAISKNRSIAKKIFAAIKYFHHTKMLSI